MLTTDVFQAIQRDLTKQGRALRECQIGRSSRIIVDGEFYDLTMTVNLKKVPD